MTEAVFRGEELSLRIDGEEMIATIDWRPGEPMLICATSMATTPSASFAWRAATDWVRAACARASACGAEAADLAKLMPKKAPPDTHALLCPMPGLVVSVNVAEGQEVKAGETLAVVEAMKMENVLTAERDGTVKKINAKKGDSLALDDVILEFVLAGNSAQSNVLRIRMNSRGWD